MRRALESLPWVRRATVDFEARRVTVTVLADAFDEEALITVLAKAGFGGEVVSPPEKAVKKDTFPVAAFRVRGMKKTKSGAT